MRRLLSFIGIFALMALGFGAGVFYMLLPRTPVVLNQDAVVDNVTTTDVQVELKNNAGQYIDIQPPEAKTLFIFLPWWFSAPAGV